MNFARYTERSRDAIESGQGIAARFGHQNVDVDHLLLALIEQADGLSRPLLRITGIDAESLAAQLYGDLQRLPVVPSGSAISMTKRLRKVLRAAESEAAAHADDYVSVEYLLLALLDDVIGGQVLRELGLTADHLRTAVEQIRGSRRVTDPNAEANWGALTRFGSDFTALALEGKLAPVIGRNGDIRRVIEILSRRSKNSPILLGDPGVGKTAIVEGVAQRIARRDVCDSLRNCRLVGIDLGAVIAGASVRGVFEERLRAVLNEAQDSSNEVILFIDGIDMLVTSGAAVGGIDPCDLLKPMLARGQLRCIAATTFEGYRKAVQRDAVLARRFQPVLIEPPSVEATISILRGLRPEYESHHRLRIADNALVTAATLSHRFIIDRSLPDKAIDLIDESAAQRRTEIDAGDRDVTANTLPFKEDVSSSDVARAVERWTGIPMSTSSEAETEKLLRLEEELLRRVVGQDDAVKAVANALIRARSGLRDSHRPMATFFFLGPTGVGKTELAIGIAQLVFRHEAALIRFDMSEYAEKSSAARLVGAPPGYLGHQESGRLTEAVRRRPHSLLLFDDVDKAHSDVFHLLMQIVDQGRLTDSYGREVSFRDAVVVLAATVESEAALAHEGRALAAIASAPRTRFGPDVLHRMDDVVSFHALSADHLKQIVRIRFDVLRAQLAERGLELEVDDAALDQIAAAAYDPASGARSLRRYFRRNLESLLAGHTLSGSLPQSGRVTIEVERGVIQLRAESSTTN